jgi:glucose-1-phosphate thymidylyltransferase
MKAIILAGGFATRLWPLTEHKAKPLLHLKDKPMISHIVEGLPRDLEIIVSTNAAFEKAFREWAGSQNRPITIFVEDAQGEDFKKGALGATALVIEHFGIREDLLLMAGDNFFGFRFDHFFRTFRDRPLLAAHDIGDRQAARKFGVVVTSAVAPTSEHPRRKPVIGFQEKPEDPKSTLVSTGCYLFPASHLEDIVHFAREKKDDLGGIFEHLLQKGVAVDAYSFSEPWFDVGSFEGYMSANRALMGSNAVMAPGTRKIGFNALLGSVYIAPGSTVENCELENVIVQKNCVLKNCVLRHCVVDEGSHLENVDLCGKMVRQNSRITKDLQGI